MKILLLGNSGIGKTRILMNYLNLDYRNITTNGIDFYCYNDIYFFDSGGDSKLVNIIKEYIPDIDLIIIVYKFNKYSE